LYKKLTENVNAAVSSDRQSAGLRENCCAISTNNHRAVILAFMDHCAMSGWTQISNWRKIVKKLRVDIPEPRCLTAQECKSLLDAIRHIVYRRGRVLRARDTAMISMLIDTGLREAELCRLKVTDVDIANKTIRVSNEAKSRRSRIVPFGESTKEALQAYLKVRALGGNCKKPVRCLERERSPYLWLTESGTVISTQRLYYIVKELALAAGIHDVDVCQSALKIDPPSASNIDPPKRVIFA